MGIWDIYVWKPLSVLPCRFPCRLLLLCDLCPSFSNGFCQAPTLFPVRNPCYLSHRTVPWNCAKHRGELLINVLTIPIPHWGNDHLAISQWTGSRPNISHMDGQMKKDPDTTKATNKSSIFRSGAEGPFFGRIREFLHPHISWLVV